MGKSLEKILNDKLELLHAALAEVDGEITEEVQAILDDTDTEVGKKLESFHFVITTLAGMIDSNKEIIKDTQYANKRLQLGIDNMNKRYHDLIKYKLETNEVATSNYRFIPKHKKASFIDPDFLKDEDLFVTVKMKLLDWDKIMLLSPNVPAAAISHKVVEPTVTQLKDDHPAKKVELTPYIQIKVNTKSIDSSKKIE